MTELETKQNIQNAIKNFENDTLYNAGINLFRMLGYNTELTNGEQNFSCTDFIDFVDGKEKINAEKIIVNDWKNCELLFQLTDDTLNKNQSGLDFGFNFSTAKDIYKSYLFFALELSGDHYSRSILATITREMNKPFMMPVFVLFKYADKITLSVIDRRLNKKDDSRDVLEKITMIKDIEIKNPHRGHIDILFDFSLEQIYKMEHFSNIEEYHNALKVILSLNELNKKFYNELFAWYEYAVKFVKFPKGQGKNVVFYGSKENEKEISTHVIRLITRLIFVWFIKQKNLIPENLFNKEKLKEILDNFEDDRFNSLEDGTYYNAILQNLFFATLNNPVNERAFADNGEDYSKHYGIKTLYRDSKEKSFFKISHKDFIKEFSTIPYLNGGLFECLDHFDENDTKYNQQIYVDGFSSEDNRKAFIPNALFFNEEKGIIPLLNRYKFTVEENTSFEQTVALDPELLGKVFENLLGVYNPETLESARKDSGSFYTPREIVDYMVDESIKNYLLKSSDFTKDEIDSVMKLNSQDLNIELDKAKKIIEKLYNIKIFDPACGSGAFPMGMLNKLESVIVNLSEYCLKKIQCSKELKNSESIVLKKGDIISYSPDDNFNIKCKYLGNYYFEVLKNSDVIVSKIKVDDMTLFVKGIIEEYNHDQKNKKTIANIFSQGHLNGNTSFISIQQKQKLSRIIDDEQNIIWEYKSYNTKTKKIFNDELLYNIISSPKTTDKNHYNLKLALIQNCIYGSDIQNIAVQISKLRFFISLICEQEKIDGAENFGINTLPNLETKIVCANSLIGIKNSDDILIDSVAPLRNDLKMIRDSHTVAKTAEQKKELRKADKQKRDEIAELVRKNHCEANVDVINKLEVELKNLKEQFESVKDPKWVDKTEAQNDLFGSSSPKLFSVDENKEKRDMITKEIKKCNSMIEAEKNKKADEQFDEEIKMLLAWNPYDQNSSSPFFDAEWMFGITDGFDIVIGNPPYISTKGVTAEDKKRYEAEFGFSDDTYNLFTFKGLSLCKTGGTLNYIIPKTFWTTQTKRNMRDLILNKQINYIFDTADPFESAMVDTCVIQIQNTNFEKSHKIKFRDGSKDLQNPVDFEPIEQSVYINTQNSVIFKPTELNLKIYKKYGAKVKELYDTWWDKIKTSRDIENNKAELEKYRHSLKPGDVALLGCLTEGGQGLATANNGKYIAVRKSTKWANNIIESRPKKLAEAITKKKIKIKGLDNPRNASEFLSKKTEKEIAVLFDELKEKYGRDIFGQGYIYKLIDDSEVADVEKLTKDEKENGIDTKKKYYVPYDKGDKDGNRWYLETPFAIAWSKENVQFLKTNSGKKGEGMPVVRNPQFYFREGFSWTDINSTFLKARSKMNGVFDVVSMSLFTKIYLPDWYYVCLINTSIISYYVDDFINNTSHFQINDARQLPIVIPTETQLAEFKKIFETAVELKKTPNSEKELELLENQLDEKVANLYGI